MLLASASPGRMLNTIFVSFLHSAHKSTSLGRAGGACPQKARRMEVCDETLFPLQRVSRPRPSSSQASLGRLLPRKQDVHDTDSSVAATFHVPKAGVRLTTSPAGTEGGLGSCSNVVRSAIHLSAHNNLCTSPSSPATSFHGEDFHVHQKNDDRQNRLTIATVFGMGPDGQSLS